MNILSVRRLWKAYAGQVVLERVNLEIERGAFCAIVGASGCGKSTFLRLLLSQEAPSRGELLLDGSPLPADPTSDRGVVFQRYSVFPHLTVSENVLLGRELESAAVTGRLFGTARRRAMEETLVQLEAVGLADARDKYPAALSGGMQQRLAIAQALAKRPKILLMDEPFGALDPGTRADMHELILSLWRETGMTVFMVTHDLDEGFKLATRLLVFDKVRLDPHDPTAFGATITYDLPLTRKSESQRREILQLPRKQKD